MAENKGVKNHTDVCPSISNSVNNNNLNNTSHDSEQLAPAPDNMHLSSISNNNGKPSIAVSEYHENGFTDTSGAAETSSMTSKTSRTSHFARRLSLRKSRAAAWLSTRLRGHQKNNDLSAAFNLLDQDNKSMLVDLNKATEEELMTVSGITRFIARSIVEYRTTIGGFRRLQDLALVSGVGAAKMAQLCRDLTITENVEEESNASSDQDSSAAISPSSAPVTMASPLPYSLKPPSYSVPGSHLSTPYSSSASSHSPLREPSITSISKGTPLKKVNINSASIFDLMSVPGVNQEMAAQIVHHRDKKGPFKTPEDVAKVRGVRPRAARHVLPYLLVDSSTSSPASNQSDTGHIAVSSPHSPESKSNSSIYNGGCGHGTPGIRATAERRPSNKHLFRTQHHGHRRTLSAPSHHNNLLLSSILDVPPSSLRDTDALLKVIEQAGDDSQVGSPRISGHRLSLEFTSDVYELLSLRSERPEIHGLFENAHKGRSAVRVATWSLCHLTPDKLSNPGVMEVLCRTVLERGFTVLAVQDVIGANLLPRICHELNTGTLRRVREWPGKQGAWACRVSQAPVSRYSFRREVSSTCNEYVGFLYNEKFVELLEDSILDTPGNHALVSKPHLGRFKSNNVNFSIVNLHGKLQSFIDRSESFLQTCDHFLKPLCFSEAIGDSVSEGPLPAADVKPAKNLQNGFIEDRSRNSSDDNSAPINRADEGGGSSDASQARRRLEFSQSVDGQHQQLQEALTAVWQHLRASVLEKGAVIVLGNFGVAPDSAGVAELTSLGYSSVLSADVSTVLCSSTSTTPPQLRADQLWVSSTLAQHHYTGNCSVVKTGLSHLAIPRGWGWGGLATSHCPLYADFYTDAAVDS